MLALENRGGFMKKIVIICLLNLAQVYAKDLSFKLGAASIGYDKISPQQYKIIDVIGKSYAVTEGISLSMDGCYSKKLDNQSYYPYKYSYVPLEFSEDFLVETKGQKLLVTENILNLEKSVNKQFKKELPFYCKIKSKSVIIVTIEYDGIYWDTYIFIEVKGDKYFTKNLIGETIVLDENVLLDFNI